MDRTTKIVLVKKYPRYNLYRATNRNGATELFKLNIEHIYLLEEYHYLLCLSQDGHRISRRMLDKNNKFVKTVPLGKDVMGLAHTDKKVIVDHINHDRNDYRKEMMKETDYSGNLRNRKSWKWSRKYPKNVFPKPSGNFMVLINKKILGTYPTVDEAVNVRDSYRQQMEAS